MKIAATEIAKGAVSAAGQRQAPDPAAFKSALEKADVKLREGEKTAPVDGRARYLEIVSGAREGMFINTSGNARHGQAFVRSVKDGVEHHIYGSGDGRVVVSNEASKRKGEKTEPVEGRKRYEEIVSGAREGMYINTSGNARDGKAFVRVIDDGVEYHVYGSGDDRVTIANDLRDKEDPALQLRKGERVKRVEGRENYVEIVSGAREGMFINTSGNARHGQAFVRSVKDGVEQHIYGSGDDRVVVSNAK
jgi:multidrug efflux pump subunit AcrA (membrane-fusion protein)